MRIKSLVVVSLLLAAVLFSACSGVSAAPAPRTLTVTGSSEVFLTPDIAYIQVGVRTQDADVAAAVAQNNTQVERVMATLNDFGIAAEDIRTSNFSLYSFEDSGFEFEGEGGGRGLQYVVENTVYVTVRDLSQMGEVLEAAVESGANNIFGIQFDVADKSAALSEGREAALANAQAQAEEIAGYAGAGLGQIQSISYADSGYPIPVFDGRGGGGGDAEAALSISPGQLSFSVQVNVIYQIN
jgi:hypothetical protein